MNPTHVQNMVLRHSRERGYSMIELSVALVIALFLLNGMFMILQNTRNTSANQSALAQLQDEERMAMTMVTDVVQLAGSHPSSDTVDVTAALHASPLFTVDGQSVFGAPNATAAYGDTLSIRYQGDATNNVLDCGGSVIGNGVVKEMTFQVDVNPNFNGTNPPSWLDCSINGAQPIHLIPNVTSLAVQYGVDANNSGSVNTYLTSSQMPGLWSSVMSVKITLSFANPLANQPGQRQTLPFNRVISVQSKTGNNALNFY